MSSNNTEQMKVLNECQGCLGRIRPRKMKESDEVRCGYCYWGKERTNKDTCKGVKSYVMDRYGEYYNPPDPYKTGYKGIKK